MKHTQHILNQEGSKHVKGNDTQHAALLWKILVTFYFCLLMDIAFPLWSILSSKSKSGTSP